MQQQQHMENMKAVFTVPVPLKENLDVTFLFES
jgi:hypothetical protein